MRLLASLVRTAYTTHLTSYMDSSPYIPISTGSLPVQPADNASCTPPLQIVVGWSQLRHREETKIVAGRFVSIVV